MAHHRLQNSHAVVPCAQPAHCWTLGCYLQGNIVVNLNINELIEYNCRWLDAMLQHKA